MAIWEREDYSRLGPEERLRLLHSNGRLIRRMLAMQPGEIMEFRNDYVQKRIKRLLKWYNPEEAKKFRWQKVWREDQAAHLVKREAVV